MIAGLGSLGSGQVHSQSGLVAVRICIQGQPQVSTDGQAKHAHNGSLVVQGKRDPVLYIILYIIVTFLTLCSHVLPIQPLEGRKTACCYS